MRTNTGSCTVRAAVVSAMLMAGAAHANHLRITNVNMSRRDAGTAFVRFNIAWENSWRLTNGNHDAAWVFFKVRPDASTDWQHARLEGAGLNPAGYGTGSGTPVELVVPDDRAGLFVRRAGHGGGATSVQGVQVVWNFASNGLDRADACALQAYGVEMVLVPEGTNTVGDGTATSIQGHFEADVSGLPFAITNEAVEITLGGGAVGSLGNNDATGMNASKRDDFNDSTSQTLPVAFPKGYAAFYCMKYEVTQGQYADFLNTLNRRQQGTRCTPTTVGYYMADSAGGSATVKSRNTVQLIADPGDPDRRVYATATPDRACNWLSTPDVCAMADWMGLRPMTELEYEKACRGPLAPVADEYAYGSAIATSISELVGDDGSGSEYYANGNLHYSLSGGPAGPLRVGIFAAKPGGDRIGAGASFWGILELSGNVWERVVTVGSEYLGFGRTFTGLHGDGVLNAAGFTDVPYWPGDSAYGSGFRGGAFGSASKRARASSREFAAVYTFTRSLDYGGRAVRTAPAGVAYDACTAQTPAPCQGGAYDGWDTATAVWRMAGTVLCIF